MDHPSMSALHLISGIINAPKFHRQINLSPPELTEKCVHLLTNLGQNREFAIKSNYEMVEFLNRTILPFDDAGYMRVCRHFVQELLSVAGPQHNMWGAISFVMLSTTKTLIDEEEYPVWHRLNARFFEVLLDSGVISQEDERRLKNKNLSHTPQTETPQTETPQTETPQTEISSSFEPPSISHQLERSPLNDSHSKPGPSKQTEPSP